jgi:hypothetical protein
VGQEATICAPRDSCSPRGRCKSSTIELDGGTGGNGGSGADGGDCPGVNVDYSRQTPTVILLIDQSGSMDRPFGDSDRWNTLHTALVDPTTGIIANLENDVRFGLALYTSHNGNQGGECPILTEVPIALGNYAAITAVYDNAGPDGDTPTGESIAAVTTQLVAFSEPGQKVIVLATDGEPDTCDEPNPQNGQPESIQAAQDAFQQGVFTFVISVGQDTSLAHLQDVANAGQGLAIGGSQNATYYVANDQAQLEAAFDTIINGVRSCVLALNGVVNPNRASEGQVTLDGTQLVFEDPDGWRLVDTDKVELLGAACEAIKTGEHDIDVIFTCDIVTIPE